MTGFEQRSNLMRGVFCTGEEESCNQRGRSQQSLTLALDQVSMFSPKLVKSLEAVPTLIRILNVFVTDLTLIEGELVVIWEGIAVRWRLLAPSVAGFEQRNLES